MFIMKLSFSETRDRYTYLLDGETGNTHSDVAAKVAIGSTKIVMEG
jgi:hypothetical protein